MRNCPNCGAVAEGTYCSYCNTPLYTKEEALRGSIGKTVHMFYENDGKLHAMDVVVDEIESSNSFSLYENDGVYMRVVSSSEVLIHARVQDLDISKWKTELLPT